MAKITIHCVRHAQGFHNLNAANHALHDPDLTPFGEDQCSALNALFPYHTSITHLVASPLRRTLYTCILSFLPSIRDRGLKVLALPELQEASSLPCDTGNSPSVLAAEFSNGDFKDVVDFNLVHEGWNSNEGKWSPASSALEARAREARVWLQKLGREAVETGEEDVNIVVVTHGGFLHYFTEDWDGAERFTGTGWANTEWRSYEFVDAEGREDQGASLSEKRESREKRRGAETPLSADEQRELRNAAEREWVESGFQKPRETPRESESAKL